MRMHPPVLFSPSNRRAAHAKLIQIISMIERHQDKLCLMRCTGFVILWIPFHILRLVSWETSSSIRKEMEREHPDIIALRVIFPEPAVATFKGDGLLLCFISLIFENGRTSQKSIKVKVCSNSLILLNTLKLDTLLR